MRVRQGTKGRRGVVSPGGLREGEGELYAKRWIVNRADAKLRCQRDPASGRHDWKDTGAASRKAVGSGRHKRIISTSEIGADIETWRSALP